MSNVVFRGTIAEALAAGLSINGVVLDQPKISIMTTIGRGVFCKAVGTVARPAGTKGKPATIWEFSDSVSLAATIGGEKPERTVASKAVGPVAVLTKPTDRIEPISADEYDDLMADDAPATYEDADGVWRISEPLRMAS